MLARRTSFPPMNDFRPPLELLLSSFLAVFVSTNPLRMKGFVHPQNAPTRMSESASAAFTIIQTNGSPRLSLTVALVRNVAVTRVARMSLGWYEGMLMLWQLVGNGSDR